MVGVNGGGGVAGDIVENGSDGWSITGMVDATGCITGTSFGRLAGNASSSVSDARLLPMLELSTELDDAIGRPPKFRAASKTSSKRDARSLNSAGDRERNRSIRELGGTWNWAGMLTKTPRRTVRSVLVRPGQSATVW